MAIEKQFNWLFKKTLFLWLPIAVIIILIRQRRAERSKKAEEEE